MASPSQYRLLHGKGQSSLSLPAGSYIYSLCQSGIDALAAISSDNSLRRFDRETLKVLPNGVFANIHPGNGGGVTCVCEVDPVVAEGKTLVATSGRDGTVKLWDARDKRRDEVLTATSAKAAPITALTCGPGPCTIVAGTEFVASQSSVFCWDIRSPGQPCLQYVESHNDDITEVINSIRFSHSFHTPNFFPFPFYMLVPGFCLRLVRKPPRDLTQAVQISPKAPLMRS
ncbi:WD domain-containing protein [Histoplasma ohiense]|nr:WD domain-containing protein [Histoplasma ohiense (nom. inval.)]